MLSSIQAMLRLRKLVFDADSYTSSLTESVRPAKRDRPSWRKRHFVRFGLAGCQARRRDGAGVDHRIRAAIAGAFDAGQELNAYPVAFAPSRFACAGRADQVAHQREHERLGHAHDRKGVSASPAENTRPSTDTTQMPNNALGTRASAGIHLRILAERHRAEARMRFGDQAG
jgi:hypothetical protein